MGLRPLTPALIAEGLGGTVLVHDGGQDDETRDDETQHEKGPATLLRDGTRTN